jgi:hypothetical protein
METGTYPGEADMIDEAHSGKLRSLEPEDIKQVCNLIRGFKIAMSNLLLYPTGSDLLTESIGSVGAMMATVLDKYKILILSEAEGTFLGNAVRLDIEEKNVGKGVFADALDACSIKSMTFKQGVTIEELHLLLDSLANKRNLKGTGDSITKVFLAENVSHIGLNEKVYAAIGDSDIVIERGAEIIEKSGGSIDGIMDALRGVTEMVSSIGDESTRDKMKLEIAEKLIATDPGLLVDLVKRRPHLEETVDVGAAPGVKAGDVGFSQAEVKEIVSDFTTAYRELVQGDEKGLFSLRSAIDRIVLLAKDRIPSLELYEELVKETGTLSTEVEVQPQPVGKTTKERLEGMTRKDSLSLITDEGTQSIQKLLENSVSEEELEIAGKLCDMLSSNFGAAISDVRLRTAMALKKLYPAIGALGKPEIVQSVDARLVEAAKKESHGEAYSQIVSILVGAANRYLKEGDREKTLEMIRLFKKDAINTAAEFADKRERADDKLHELADGELTRLLLEDFCSGGDAVRKGVAPILLELGDFGVSSVVKKIGETVDTETRKSLAFLLERIGETAVARLVEELDTEKRVEVSLRIVDLLDKIGHEELVVEQLRKVLSSPDFQVRRAAVHKLNQIGTPRAQQVMVDVLINDPSPGIRQFCVGFLGEMRYAGATDTLVEMLSSRHTGLGKAGESIQQEICASLANIGDSSVIPALREAANPPRSFRSVKPEGVRVAAVQALATLGDKGLVEFAEDRNPLIRKIVRESGSTGVES